MKIKSTIAFANSSDSIRHLARTHFEQAGFTVFPVAEAMELAGVLDRKPVDLVVLDLAMPGLDGLGLTRSLRRESDIGIILVAAADDAHQRIAGLRLGADEVMAQPVDWAEMIVRAGNLARRVQTTIQREPGRKKCFNGWTLHLDKRRLVAADGADIRLTGAEFELLAVFVSNPGRTLDRDFLLETTTRRKADPQDRTIDTLVRRLRRLLETDSRNPRLLTTVHGQGYIFTGDVG